MPPPNIHAMAAAPSAKAKSVALQAAREARGGPNHLPSTGQSLPIGLAPWTALRLEDSPRPEFPETLAGGCPRTLSAEADAYNKARAEGARS